MPMNCAAAMPRKVAPMLTVTVAVCSLSALDPCHPAVAGERLAGQPLTCGLLALQGLMALLDGDGAAAARAATLSGATGTSLADLVHTAGLLGCRLRPVRLTTEELLRDGRPAIVHLNGVPGGHFAVLLDGAASGVRIWDGPGTSVAVWSCEHWDRQFTGYAAILADPAAQPAGHWAASDYDFGELTGAGEVVHDFVCRNDGPTALKLTVVRTSCSCTAATVGQATVPPGGSTVIRVTARFAVGSGQHEVWVASNDPSRRLHVLTVRARRDLGEVVVSPPRLHLSAVAGEVATSAVELTGARALVLRSLTTSVPWLEGAVTRREVNGTASRTALTVTARPPRPGSYHEWLEVTTNLPDAPALRLPCTVEAMDDLAFEPSEAFAGEVGIGQQRALEMVLWSRAGRRLTKVSARCDDDAVKVTARPVSGESSRYRLVLVVEGRREGIIAAKVTVKVEVQGRAEERVTTLYARVVPVAG